MSERTPVLFAPGIRGGFYVNWRRYTGSHERVMDAFRSAGLEPHFFQPDWRHHDPKEWATNMTQRATSIAGENGGSIVMSGFSCGALVATLGTRRLLDANKVHVAGLFVGSLPLWFGELGIRHDILDSRSGLHDASEELKGNLCMLELP